MTVIPYNPRKDAEAILTGPLKRRQYTVETREGIEEMLVALASRIANEIKPGSVIEVVEKFR